MGLVASEFRPLNRPGGWVNSFQSVTNAAAPQLPTWHLADVAAPNSDAFEAFKANHHPVVVISDIANVVWKARSLSGLLSR